jgi:hypothetical protein
MSKSVLAQSRHSKERDVYICVYDCVYYLAFPI